MTRLALATFAAAVLALALSAFDVHRNVIYGDDGRHELFEETDAGLRKLADSTVALFLNSSLSRQTDGNFRVLGATFQKEFRLCDDEPFKDQTSGAYCSGFLVGEDTIATAGHCIPDALKCSQTWIAFGFAYSQQGATAENLRGEDVYRCKAILHREKNDTGADFEIVQLDRAVVGRDPLPLRTQGTIAQGDELTVLGYPSGIPMKIASGATVRDANRNGYFVTNTDTYGGNSGSPIVSTDGQFVEGILVRGEVDFITTPEGCLRSYRCDIDKCRGEDVTKISVVLPYIPAAAPLMRTTAAE